MLFICKSFKRKRKNVQNFILIGQLHQKNSCNIENCLMKKKRKQEDFIIYLPTTIYCRSFRLKKKTALLL